MNPLSIDVRRPSDVMIRSAKADSDEGQIQSLARGIEVLRAFGPETDRMTIAEAARATGLTRAGARRILLTLERLGYVRSDGRCYYMTARARSGTWISRAAIVASRPACAVDRFSGAE
jgi:CRP-like cAMP-binding protein